MIANHENSDTQFNGFSEVTRCTREFTEATRTCLEVIAQSDGLNTSYADQENVERRFRRSSIACSVTGHCSNERVEIRK